MVPSSARTTPVMRLNIVVLPAPFGPTMNTTSFSWTVNETSPTARRPPPQLSHDRAHDALGQEQHDHDDEHAVDEQVRLLEDVLEDLGAGLEDDGADDGAEQGPGAAEHGHD